MNNLSDCGNIYYTGFDKNGYWGKHRYEDIDHFLSPCLTVHWGKQEEEKEDTMEKTYQAYAVGYGNILTRPKKNYDEVEKEAKNWTAKNGYEVIIFEAIASTKAPVADIEVVKIS